MNQEKPKADLRVRKTKTAISSAFVLLLSQKSLNDITISDIAKAAQINRKTFYRHYRGIYELVDELENNIVSEFERVIKESNIQNPFNEAHIIFRKLTEVLNRSRDFYTCLLNVDLRAGLLAKILDSLKQLVRNKLADSMSLPEHEITIITEYFVAGIIAVYQSWFNSGCIESPEEIARVIGTISVDGISGIIDRK